MRRAVVLLRHVQRHTHNRGNWSGAFAAHMSSGDHIAPSVRLDVIKVLSAEKLLTRAHAAHPGQEALLLSLGQVITLACVQGTKIPSVTSPQHRETARGMIMMAPVVGVKTGLSMTPGCPQFMERRKIDRCYSQ